MSNTMKQHNKSVIFREIDPKDRREKHTPTVIERVSSRTQPGDIVLMHDVHKTTVDAVPTIIKNLHKKGYKFVTVSELIGPPIPGKTYHNQYR